MNIGELVKEALSLFPQNDRPAHFTDPEHCEECRDHDKALLANTREKISYDILGNPGWDPICFINEPGFKYYFPAMVRLALEGTGNEYYIDQFLFHITQNAHCMSFSEAQSLFVVKVLDCLIEKKTEEIDANLDSDDLLSAIERWNR